MSSRVAGSRLRALLRLPRVHWSAPPQPQLCSNGDALAALSYATSATPPADDDAAPRGKDYWRSLAERRLQGLKPDAEAAAGLAVAEAADPDATVSPAEAAADGTPDSQTPATESSQPSAAVETASSDIGTRAAGPGLQPLPADDAAFEGAAGATRAGNLTDTAASARAPAEQVVQLDAVRDYARRRTGLSPYMERLLQAQYLLRRRRREEGAELDPAVMNDLKHAIAGGRQGTAQQQQRASAANHGFAAAQDPGADPREATATAAEPGVELLAGDAAAAAARIDMLAAEQSVAEQLSTADQPSAPTSEAAAVDDVSEPVDGDSLVVDEQQDPVDLLTQRPAGVKGPRQWRRPGLDGANLADPQTGFAALGTPRWSAPVDDPAAALADGQPQQPRELRITPFRSFFPGQLYEPTDLNPFLERSTSPARQPPGVAGLTLPSNAEVMEQADFRNVPFIGRYMTPTGQLVPRRRTRLQQKVHRHLCRQIKLAKIMALVPVDRAPTLPRTRKQRQQQQLRAQADDSSPPDQQSPEDASAAGVPAHLRWPRPPTVRAQAALAEAYGRSPRRQLARGGGP